ncbi:hypothetical protein [Dyadobacter sp.]|uniref:hypothetical protein n=1 Tax=Dyadobacter sp. TaxID=1914288 RepID=UPI003F6F1991
MSKPRLSIGAWLDQVFGKTHKDLSETLSTEQYNDFVKGATSIRGAVDTEEEETQDTAGDGQEVKGSKEAAESKTEVLDTDLSAKVLALTNQLSEAQSALTTEKEAHAATAGKLTEAENSLKETTTKLEASELQKQKLRDAVNPLGDEDLSNKEGTGADAGLTKTDLEAREAHKRNRSEA